MNELNPKVDLYLEDGCGRCDLYKTPECKVHTWHKELVALRKIVLACGLKEEVKWSFPCYTYNGKNVLMLGTLKDYATLSFFKGTLMKDPYKILEKPGKNSQAYSLIKVTDYNDVLKDEAIIKSYIFEAIDIEKAGLKVEFKKNPEPIPEEFEQKLEENPELKAAFEALTPGRQRGYIIYFSAPKQSATKVSRIEKMTAKILSGKGFHD